MNINKPSNIFRVGQTNFNLNDIRVNRFENSPDVKKLDQQKKFPTDLVQTLKQWEQNDQLENTNNARWSLSKIPLTYFVNSGTSIDGFINEFESVIHNSFLEWSRASFGKIRFLKCLTESQADITVNWTDSIIIGRDYECGHNNLKIIGNRIEKADISIVVLPAIDKFLSKMNRIERVRRTLLHEIGHSLGLKHSTDAKDIMFHRGIENKNISDNDAQALINLYNSPNANEYSI